MEASFVTTLASKFVKKKFLIYTKDSTDKRIKKVASTKKGHSFVTQTEKTISKESEKWLDGLSVSEVRTFIKVLRKLIEKNQ